MIFTGISDAVRIGCNRARFNFVILLWLGGAQPRQKRGAEGELLRQVQDGERSRTIAPLAEVRSDIHSIIKYLCHGALGPSMTNGLPVSGKINVNYK